MQQVPRDFNAKIPILTTLGISNYDAVASMDKLVFNMREALKKFQEDWKTLNSDKIKRLIRFCLMRELVSVEGRKDAIEYNKRRPIFDFLEEDLKSTNMSASKVGSMSPNKKPAILSGRM